ncbi:MAG: DUF1957 domain-containing protein [Firmicutes bacterium]|nr:DUF1957 domain-containing protein [Bacillota bacterium]MCL5038243.1 DUF1957 domain-containing protein [Bacillota bacterium]
MPKGYLAILLHAHLPFVRHLQNEHPLEEKWLFEAMTECYIPLLQTFQRLTRDGVPFRVTLSLSPTLLSMLVDPLLQERYDRHLTALFELAGLEVERTAHDPQLSQLARMYQENFRQALDFYENRYQGNLIKAFQELAEAGSLEIITTAATHGYFPLLELSQAALRGQIEAAVTLFSQLFGAGPRGFWLPECGYSPGNDKVLTDLGIEYTMLESHGLSNGKPRPRQGVYRPVRTPDGLTIVGRDKESSKQVWSSKEGYPGDYDYREFYRDIGYDLEWEYVRGFLPGVRTHLGLKYYRITGKTNEKEYYRPDWARAKAALHAGNFMFNREKQVEYLSSMMDEPPIILAPYDAELFGHWWYEGPLWLEYLLRKMAYDQDVIKTITPGEYIVKYPPQEVVTPSLSSWGHQGYSEVWLNGANDWVYRHLHKAAERMIELARANPGAEGSRRRGLNQAARELLLAQSSDWPFIMYTGTVVDYAKSRFLEHISRFTFLYEGLTQGEVPEEDLKRMEEEDNLFPGLDYSIYAQ